MYISIHKRTYVLFIISLLVSCGAQAQKKRAKPDTLSIYREFMQLSNLYQQLPLYLQMEVQSSTNVIRSKEDTAVMKAELYLLPNESYIRFGETEQMANDSVALLVSNKLQRMFLYNNAQPIKERMKAFAGLQLKDSSIMALAHKFSASQSSSDELFTILLNSRTLLYGSSLSKESIEMQYDAKTKQPLSVTTVKRSLLPLEEEAYKMLGAQTEKASMLMAIEGKGYFMIREQSVRFLYKAIRQGAGIRVPATVADRISRNEDGAFIPVKNFEDYTVTNN